MRKFVPLVLLGAALLSCEQPLFHTPSREGGAGAGRTPTQPPPDSSRKDRSVYATALVFPDTVNWRQGGRDGAKVVLFKDGAPVGSVPAGDRASHDSHHYQDGHLWVSVTDGAQTSISCDGTTFFTYSGEEALQGLLVADGSVHTLGQYPGGGLCYRIDGMEVYSSRTGTVLGWAGDPDWPGGALCHDASGVYYTFGMLQASADTDIWEYRVMKGAEVRKELKLPSGASLYDVRVYGGKVYRLEWRYGKYCLMVDDVLTPLPLEGEKHNIKLVQVDGRILVKGFDYGNGESVCWIQGADSTRYEFAYPRFPVETLLVDGDETAAVVLEHEDCVFRLIRGERDILLPLETYRLKTPRCAVFSKGIFAVALTGEYENEHLLVVDEKQSPVRFNGYFTGIYIE